MTIATDKLLFMRDWAARFDCALVEKGSVGFGRPAVGVFYGNAFAEFDSMDRETWTIWRPEDHYHKWDSLCVLVHDEDYDKALEQLFEWITWLDDNGWGIKVRSRETYNTDGFGRQIELILNGISQPMVVKL